MSSTVHYKLKSSSSANSGAASGGWSTLHFDGVYLSILEFKRKVIYKEQWCKSEADANFDLLVSNSNSGEGQNTHDGRRTHASKGEARLQVEALRLFGAPVDVSDLRV